MAQVDERPVVGTGDHLPLRALRDLARAVMGPGGPVLGRILHCGLVSAGVLYHRSLSPTSLNFAAVTFSSSNLLEKKMGERKMNSFSFPAFSFLKQNTYDHFCVLRFKTQDLLPQPQRARERAAAGLDVDPAAAGRAALAEAAVAGAAGFQALAVLRLVHHGEAIAHEGDGGLEEIAAWILSGGNAGWLAGLGQSGSPLLPGEGQVVREDWTGTTSRRPAVESVTAFLVASGGFSGRQTSRHDDCHVLPFALHAAHITCNSYIWLSPFVILLSHLLLSFTFVFRSRALIAFSRSTRSV